MHEETLSKDTGIVLEKLVDVARPFYLAGGTALALQFGHRISVDLDFFIPELFDVKKLINDLSKVGNLEIEDESDITFNGSLDGVKISFFKYNYPLLFETKDFKGVKLADERDIGAMKIEAISNRGSKKDFVDMYVLLKKYSFEEILGFFHDKYKEFNYNTIHILKSLTYFFNADESSEPEMLIPDNWNDMKKYINKTINNYLDSKKN